jgi:hypothetical protein
MAEWSMIKDAQGQSVTGATTDAIALYDQAVRAFNVGYGDVAGLFDAARNAAPDFVMRTWRRLGCLPLPAIRLSRRTPGLCWKPPGTWR